MRKICCFLHSPLLTLGLGAKVLTLLPRSNYSPCSFLSAGTVSALLQSFISSPNWQSSAPPQCLSPIHPHPPPTSLFFPFIFKRILMGKLSTGYPEMEASLVDIEEEDLELCICGTSRILKTQFENCSSKNMSLVVSWNLKSSHLWICDLGFLTYTAGWEIPTSQNFLLTLNELYQTHSRDLITL